MKSELNAALSRAFADGQYSTIVTEKADHVTSKKETMIGTSRTSQGAGRQKYRKAETRDDQQ